MTDQDFVIDPGVDIGHVHLKVADIDRSLAFYCGVLGFELIARMGDQAAFISAGGYHHHIGLNTWESRGGTPPPPGHTGLFHAAGPTMLSRIDFARLACRLLSLDPSLLIPLTTPELHQRAARPLIAGLDSTLLNTTLGRPFFRTPEQGIRDWQAALQL